MEGKYGNHHSSEKVSRSDEYFDSSSSILQNDEDNLLSKPTSSRNNSKTFEQKNVIRVHDNIYDDEETTTSVVLDEFEISSSNSMITSDTVSVDIIEEISSMDTSSAKLEGNNCMIHLNKPETYVTEDKNFSKKNDSRIQPEHCNASNVILEKKEKNDQNQCLSNENLTSEIYRNLKIPNNEFRCIGDSTPSDNICRITNVHRQFQSSTNQESDSKMHSIQQTGESQNAMFLSLKKMSLGSTKLHAINAENKVYDNINQYKDDIIISTTPKKNNFTFINSCALHSKMLSCDNLPSCSNNMNKNVSSEFKDILTSTRSSRHSTIQKSEVVVPIASDLKIFNCANTSNNDSNENTISLSEHSIKKSLGCNAENRIDICSRDGCSRTTALPPHHYYEHDTDKELPPVEEIPSDPKPSSSLNCIQNSSEYSSSVSAANTVDDSNNFNIIKNLDPMTENSTKVNCLRIEDKLDKLKFRKFATSIKLSSQTDLNEKNWVDCDEANISDVEEICTCNLNFDCKSRSGSNTSLAEIEDLSFENIKEIGQPLEDFSNIQNNLQGKCNISFGIRKRKFNDTHPSNVEEIDPRLNTLNKDIKSRKRVAYDLSIKDENQTNVQLKIPNFNVMRRTQRSLIPTRDNPPPELEHWLTLFQHWSNAERLLAIDCLIDHCNPTQVRHMMKIIEPQFQRDFISLLPRELALSVLSYLEPKDLLKAAQTCRSWRFLCDDNLLWKEKCRKAQIMTEPRYDRQTRARACPVASVLSPWKAAYMRQHIIEMNWRSRPIREPKVLKGHDDHVITCLQFSGNRIVSGSDDNTLKVWSAVTGRCLRTLIGHTGGVWSSQMSGNIIISGSTDRTLKVWDMETGQCIHTLMGHTSTVRCMHLHGNKVVSGSRDATLRVWDIQQGNCLHVLIGHLAAVRCVQYDGKLIVSGAYDYMVKIWHPERQECLHTLQGHTNRVYSLQFDGLHVVSGSLDTSIRVWDVETGSCKHTLMGHQSLTSGMELRQNILVSGNADSTVKVWDITTGQCLQTLSGPHKHQSAVTCLQFNSRFVVTSSDDGTVKLWDVKTGEFIRNLVSLDSGGSGGVVWRIRANDTKLICAVGSRNGTEETKLMVLDFDVEGACVKCS